MLRRYLIVNGVTTALLYGTAMAVLPSIPQAMNSVLASANTYLLEAPLLGPLIHRIVLVAL